MAFCRRIDSGRAENFDVNKLIETRLLIQANSGGGKSYALRKLLEETHSKAQQIVLDMEGEFATLREKYDYLLVGKNGDIPASPKTAEMLARKLLELKVSAIIDLYELPSHERIRFVKLFLDSMINAPKELWHPVIVVVDEAHVFCPEKDQAESAGSVKDLMTRGRKRGFCGVLATQRLSKLAKDAAAECNNKLIGRSGLDVDMKRAAEELGFTTQEQRLSLRNLPPGVFYAFGPAISEDVHQVKVEMVSTVHPKIGYRNLAELIPPARPLVLKALEGLKDLPKVAERDAMDKEALRKRVRELESDLRQALVAKPVVDDVKVARISQVLEEEKAKNRLFLAQLKTAISTIRSFEHALKHILGTISDLPDAPNIRVPSDVPHRITVSLWKEPVYDPLTNELLEEYPKLKKGARVMLGWVVAFNPRAVSREQVAVLAGFSAGGGTFQEYLSVLKRGGYIEESVDGLLPGKRGLDEIPNPPALPRDNAELVEFWAGKFKKGAGQMLRVIVSAYPNTISREEVGEQAGFSYEGGTFQEYLSCLCRAGLVEKRGNSVAASKWLFLEE